VSSAAFLAAAFFLRISDDRKSAPWSRDFNAPGRSIGYSARRTLEFLMTVKAPRGLGTSMPLDDRLGILLVVLSPAFTGSLPCKRC